MGQWVMPRVAPAGRWFALSLLLLFALIWVVLAWRPWYRQDWLLENVMVLAAVPVLVWSYRRLPLSRLSYGLIFIFLCLHEIGAHYTYSKVPYDQWIQYLSGQTLSAFLGLERNHFDRLVHLLYGVLLFYPVREIVTRLAALRGFWSYLFPFLAVVSTSMVFELIEWAAATIFGGELGMAYLGTQGDIWDAHKDMALAMFGALITIAVMIVAVRVRDEI